MNFVRFALPVLAALAAGPVLAQSTPTSPPPPGLVVTLVVDQLSANLFNQYRHRFTGGLKTLAEQGLVYVNGYQQHAATETCPGHATILTGANPDRAGIPANDWIDRATGEEVYCLAAPANALAHGRNSDNGPVGPGNLEVTGVADWLKAASPTSRVFAVSGKDRGAITLNGDAGDGAYWYTLGFGFTTYVEPGQSAEAQLAPVAAVNARIAARLATAPTTWSYTSDACRALEGEFMVAGETFRAALPREGLSLDNTPVLDELTLEAATALLDDQRLGRRGVTDMLGVSLSGTDRLGHAFGTQGPEMCEQLHRLDAALGAFLDRVAETPGGALVVLTADHGGSDAPERSAQRGFHNATRGDPGMLTRVNAALKTQFALEIDPLAYGASGVMLVGEGGRGLDHPRRDAIADAAVALLRDQPQVAGAWTLAETLASPRPAADASPQELTLLQRQRLSAVSVRSPDILLALNPNIFPGRGRVGGSISGHGTAWDYDRQVPIVFWRPGGEGQERFLPIRTIDIAPTLANVMGLTPADTVEGRCLDLAGFGAPACETPPAP